MGKDTFFGPYALQARLHKGVMAEVFRALDTRTGRACALKRILPAAAEEEDFVRELEDEAAVASTLDHPSIACVLDFGAIEGTYFIAYELVDGVDLRFVLENASLTDEPLPLPFLLHVFTRVADALGHAHARDVVHRDVSPHNIVLSHAGDVKIIDFGIAKAKGGLSRTGAGIIKGKLGYMSPEQVRGGSPDSPVDPRTDVFSLGICMWELLTLKRLFIAPNEILVLDMVKRHVPEPPSTYRRSREEGGQELDRIVLKALAKNQDERYRSARQLTKDLEDLAFTRRKSGAIATREDIAQTIRRTFGERGTAGIMELQETRMSDDNKSGSDLDIFEGLGKKSSPRTSAVPPPPPGSMGGSLGGPSSASQIPAAPAASPVAHAAPGAQGDMKKTLMGIPGPAQPPSERSLPPMPPSTPPGMPPTSASGMPSTPSAGPPSGRVSQPPPLPSSPPQSGSMRAAQPSKPPPPPGRGSLPNLQAVQGPTSSSPSQTNMPAVASPSQAPSAATKLQSQVPPPASTRPGPAASSSSPSTGSLPATAAAIPDAKPTSPNGAKLNMDWDDDDEATHVFDKEKESQPGAVAAGPESRRPEHASMDDILSSPRPSSQIPPQGPAAGTPPPPTSTLSGQFGALGQARESVNGSASSPPSSQFRSGPPPSQSLRSAPPPPPGSGPPPSLRPYNPSTSTAPMPPPPPPGQTTTAPMHMPVRHTSDHPRPPPSGHVQAQGHVQQGSVPPQQHSQPPQQHSQPPQHQPHSQPPQPHSQPPMPHMPPVNRAMEATAVVPRVQSSNAGLWVALLLGVVAAVGVAVFFMMPRTGTLVVNVADAKGAAVSKLEVLVDGKQACDSAPCIVHDISSGVHEVKVSAAGFDAPAARAITIESRKNTESNFALSASSGNGSGSHAGGTGLKVSGNPLQSGVRLVVDGKELGPLPQEMHDLQPGTHTVKVVGSDRYQPFEKTIDVKQDEMSDLGTIALKVLKGKATIQLGTPGAKVYLVSGTNRKEVPQFPIAIDFDPNEKWNLEAKMPGMDDYAQPISFDDGQAEKTIVVTLAPKGTNAATTAPVVRAPTFTAPQPAVVAAPKEPVAAKEPAAPKEPVAAKEPAAPKTPAPAAAAGGECFLNINSRPASTVLLDGKPLGPTPRVKVSVTPGTHTVLFVNAEESLKKSVSVTVAAGETKAVSAKLRD